MKANVGLAIVAVVDAVLIVAAARMPYFPTDLALARAVQSLAPLSVNASQWITATADTPRCFVLLALAVIAGWLLAGWRAGAIAILVFFGLWLFGIWLSPIVAQPRPSPTLITVVGHPKGFAFPSIFGLVYVATFGYVGTLAAIRGRGAARVIVPLVAAAALIIGAAARIVLGAHWPSDLWVAWLMGLFWIGLLMRLVPRNTP